MIIRSCKIAHAASLLAVFCSPLAIWASPISVVPPGLSSGDQYRLIFLTSDTITATSSDIHDYDQLVTDDANASSLFQPLGATWQAIVSTSMISAADHIGAFSVPIFLVTGNSVVKVANGTQDLFAGLTTVLGANIQFDENGTNVGGVTPLAWTGTGPNGSEADPLGGGASATVGCTIINTSAWIDFTDENTSLSLPLYGISSILTVPEPGHPGPMLTAAALLLAAIRRARTSKSHQS